MEMWEILIEIKQEARTKDKGKSETQVEDPMTLIPKLHVQGQRTLE